MTTVVLILTSQLSEEEKRVVVSKNISYRPLEFDGTAESCLWPFLHVIIFQGNSTIVFPLEHYAV